MNASEQVQHLKFALDHFSEFSDDDLVRWLERYKSEIEWAANSQEGDVAIAAEDLSRVLASKAHYSIPQLTRDIKRNLMIVVGLALAPENRPEPGRGSPESTKWLQVTQLVVTIVGVLVGTSYGVVGRLWPEQSTQPQKPSVPLPLVPGPKQAIVIHVLQTLVILCFVLIHRTWLRKLASQLTDAVPIAKKTLQQFTAGWMFMWYGWLALYIWFSIAAIRAALKGSSPALESISDVLDVASGFFIWWCFLALDMPSVKLSGQPKRNRPFWEAVWLTIFVGILCAALSVIDRHFHWGYFGVATVGLYNGLALASLTGRFGSHYIGTPKWMLLCLYIYSMLQLFYSFLPVLNAELWTPAIFLLALILKMVLAWAGTHMMQNGGLLRYLEAAESGALSVGDLHKENSRAVAVG